MLEWMEPVCCFCGWVPPPYVHLAFTHMMNETRPSPFFTLFRFRVLCWTQTEEQKWGRPGNKAIHTVWTCTYMYDCTVCSCILWVTGSTCSK